MLARFLQLVVLAALSIALACSERRPLDSTSSTEPLVHEPWENDEAENLAWLISGEVCAPRPLYDRIETELDVIRNRWADSIKFFDPEKSIWVYPLHFRHSPMHPAGQATLDVDVQTYIAMALGEYNDWDSLNALFQVDVQFPHQRPSLLSQARINPYRLAEAYEHLTKVRAVWLGANLGDRPNVFADLHEWGMSYLFRYGWFECPMGCTANEYFYFRSHRESIEYVGHSSSYEGNPQWWHEAESCVTLYWFGDEEYRFRDTVPPERVADLALNGVQIGETASFTFTAPADIGPRGIPDLYEFRSGSEPLTEANWPSYTNRTVEIAASAGETVTITIRSLKSDAPNYTAMRSIDHLGNRSPISDNVMSVNVLLMGWDRIDQSNSPIPDQEISAIFIDSRNRCWIGTPLGLAVISEGQWQVFSPTDHTVLADPVTAISEDEVGSIWAGTYSGAASFDGKTWTTKWPTEPTPPSNEVRCMSPGAGGSMWLGVGFMGTIRLNESGWEQFDQSNSGVRGTVVRQILHAADGAIWTAGNLGLSRFDGQAWTSRGPEKVVTSITQLDNHTIMFGTYDGYLGRVSGGELTDMLRMSPYEGHPRQSAEIPDIAQSGDGSFWISTFGSVRRYDDDSLSESLVLLPQNSGLAEREVTALAVDQNDVLWIGTRNFGVCRWDLRAAGLDRSPLITHVDE